MTIAPKFGFAAICSLLVLVPMFGTLSIVSTI